MVLTKTGLVLEDLAHTLLNIGALLMSNGANTHRIRKTLERIAEKFSCTIDLHITHKALMINIYNDNDLHFHSGIKQTTSQGINFNIVSSISILSWRVWHEDLSVEQINQEVDALSPSTHYPRILILVMVGLAGASFSRLFGGGWQDMAIAFLATFCGLFIKQEAIKGNFNSYLSTIIAAFTASLIACFFVKNYNNVHDQALYASVLFLIPGVPFINSFSDLLNNNTLNGIVRSVHGLIIAFSIAVGFMVATQICHWH